MNQRQAAVPAARGATLERETINCVFTIDDGYSQHLAVALASLIANNAAHHLDCTIVHDRMSGENLERLRGMLDRAPNARGTFIAADVSRFSHFPERDRLTVATYIVLFLPEILAGMHRVLFLDADLVVLGDVGELWSHDLQGAALAAVPDFLTIHHERLGLPATYRLFNSGVMVIDLDRWRLLGLVEKFTAYVNANSDKLFNCDQDVLNVVLQDQVSYLDLKWNRQALTSYATVAASGMTREQFRRSAEKPMIAHFAGPRKPWRYEDDTPFERYYFRYLRDTPWSAWRPPDRTLLAVVRRRLQHIGLQRLYRGARRRLKPRGGRAPERAGH